METTKDRLLELVGTGTISHSLVWSILMCWMLSIIIDNVLTYVPSLIVLEFSVA